MAIPLISRLSAPARAASPFIRGAVRAGSGADSIFTTLSSLGIAASRTEVRAIAAAERAAIARVSEFALIARNRAIPIASIPVARTTQRRRFAFTARVTGIDRFTGAQLTRHITVSSSRTLSRSSIEAMAVSAVDRGDYGDEFQAVTATFIDATQDAESLS